MSLQKKLEAFAAEAVLQERARCLWCIDQIVQELGAQLKTKILVSEAQRQGMAVKYNIARALAVQARAAIASGVGPGGRASAGVPPTTTPADAAAFQTQIDAFKGSNDA